MNEVTCTLLVIGGGPGGYVCAARAGRMGVDTVLVEAATLGGTCLNVGCIPSKALIHAAGAFHTARRQSGSGLHGVIVTEPTLDYGATRHWMGGVVDRLVSGVGGLLQRAGVRVITGRARFVDGKTLRVEGPEGDILVRAEAVVIATGSRAAAVPGLPFGGRVIDSTGALAMTQPPARLAVVGAGYIGLELGTAFAKLGSAVTLVEAAPSVLPQYDERLTRPVQRRLNDLGITLKLDARVEGWDEVKGALRIAGAEGPEELAVDRVLVTVGRVPMVDGLGLEELGLRQAGRFIAVDDGCRTSMRGVYAIGDVTEGPMLAHRAMAQGQVVADIVAGRSAGWDKVCVPAVCFTDPEILCVGLLPDAVPEADRLVSESSFRASGRALTLDDTEGFVRIVARKSDHVLLGIQAVGPGVAELASGYALALENGLLLEDVAATIHAHPTLSEGFQEAAMAATDMVNHC
ncbi:MAG: dihydrolipoyl dehydrogenase [Rhodobacteraceae bacterium]|nr:dihydrolipoyl dehydrogenase [Paracoccaceae bacterium]